MIKPGSRTVHLSGAIRPLEFVLIYVLTHSGRFPIFAVVNWGHFGDFSIHVNEMTQTMRFHQNILTGLHLINVMGHRNEHHDRDEKMDG